MDTNDIARVTRDSPAARRTATRQSFSPVLIVITALAAVGVLLYARFLLNPDNRGDLLPWLIVIAAEGVLVVHALFAMWTMLSASRDPRNYQYWTTHERLYDSADPARTLTLDQREVGVEVFVTVYGEPIEVVRRTLVAALAIRGAHRTWLLDDGSSDDMRDLADELGCYYLRRHGSAGAKAGNINHALTQAKGDFFAVFDADFVPRPEFIEEVLPFFSDDNVAFVQTPQTYGNLHTMIARGAGYMQTVFYRFIQPGRNHFNAAFCVGTNVMFRRAAVNEIGGIYADSKSEDVWTSLKLHERGWRSIYLARTLAVGDAPETIEAYTKQQLRWATGGFEILLRSNPFSRKRNLTLDQRIMYAITSTHYFTGIAPGLLLLVPPMEIYLDLHPVSVSIGVWQWLSVYSGLLPDADPAGLRDARQLPLAGADAGGGVVPDLPARVDQRPAATRAEVARHGHDRGRRVALQLHHPAGAGLRVLDHHLRGRGVAGAAPGRRHPRRGVEHHQHPDPGHVHGRRLARVAAAPPRPARLPPDTTPHHRPTSRRLA